MVLGPKYHKSCTVWALKPYYLGPWTLRETVENIGSLVSYNRSPTTHVLETSFLERLGVAETAYRKMRLPLVCGPQYCQVALARRATLSVSQKSHRLKRFAFMRG